MYGAGAAWSHLFLSGARAYPIWSEPKSAPGPRTSGAGAALKSGGSATLPFRFFEEDRVKRKIFRKFIILHSKLTGGIQGSSCRTEIPAF